MPSLGKQSFMMGRQPPAGPPPVNMPVPGPTTPPMGIGVPPVPTMPGAPTSMPAPADVQLMMALLGSPTAPVIPDMAGNLYPASPEEQAVLEAQAAARGKPKIPPRKKAAAGGSSNRNRQAADKQKGKEKK